MKQNRDKKLSRIWYNKRYQLMRVKILDLLGGRCNFCGFSDYDVLQIDHIVPIKKAPGKRMPNVQMFFHVINGNIPKEELQILCANCHMKKTVKEMRKQDEKDTSQS